MKKVFVGLALCAFVGISFWYSLGGGEAGKDSRFGSATGTVLTSIAEIQRAPGKYLNQIVTIEGEMTRQCPASGCWWYVKDDTGEIRADSTNGGFALPLNQQGKKVRTTGRVFKIVSGELEIAAMGADLH